VMLSAVLVAGEIRVIHYPHVALVRAMDDHNIARVQVLPRMNEIRHGSISSV
jgi:hypothetical protein